MKVQKRILSAYKLCEYYVNRNWDFNNDNTLKAIQKLNPRERRTYKLDGTGGNFREYFTNCVHSARLYLVKEGDDQIPAAKRQMKVLVMVEMESWEVSFDIFFFRMWCVDWFFKILIVAALAYFVWNKVC
jgi:fatty acyl-CoA reductase